MAIPGLRKARGALFYRLKMSFLVSIIWLFFKCAPNNLSRASTVFGVMEEGLISSGVRNLRVPLHFGL